MSYFGFGDNSWAYTVCTEIIYVFFFNNQRKWHHRPLVFMTVLVTHHLIYSVNIGPFFIIAINAIMPNINSNKTILYTTQFYQLLQIEFNHRCTLFKISHNLYLCENPTSLCDEITCHKDWKCQTGLVRTAESTFWSEKYKTHQKKKKNNLCFCEHVN